jgi:hypothetical protein
MAAGGFVSPDGQLQRVGGELQYQYILGTTARRLGEAFPRLISTVSCAYFNAANYWARLCGKDEAIGRMTSVSLFSGLSVSSQFSASNPIPRWQNKAADLTSPLSPDRAA